MSSGVSSDLPLYLKSKFSQLNPPSPDKKPSKAIKQSLRQGVSSDSPLFFQLNHISILDPKTRIKEISGGKSTPDRFLSDLKQNNLSSKPKFSYTDSRLSNFDYHNLKPSSIIDLSNDKSPKIKQQTRFAIEFNKHLEKGFGKSRGQFTLEAMQPKVPRYLKGKIEVLKNQLDLSYKHEHKIKINTGKTILSRPKHIIGSNTPSVDLKIKFNNRRLSTPVDLVEIEEFEGKKLKGTTQYEKRKIYAFN
jgi:hypothetical protein